MTQQFEVFLLRLSHVLQSPGFLLKAHSDYLQFLAFVLSGLLEQDLCSSQI